MIFTIFAFLAIAAPRPVTLQNHEGTWQLMVDSHPYMIKGAGGDASKSVLAAMGGNSFRTWGADNLDSQLDEAQRLGLKVTVGIWLGHKEHGFKYDDPAQVAKQFDSAKAVIQKYKDHPAVLMWALGNEMEGYESGDDPNIWMAVEDLAHMAHKIDPNHPTMSVIAEIGGKRVETLHKMCPSLDIVGINSYGGAPSIYERYIKQGGTKPYVLTEFGPPGTWEGESTPWKRPVEPTSTQKEGYYAAAYKANVVDHPNLCLGSYAFTWGNKQEATATWYGMLMPDGTKLGAVDVMQTLWSGKSPQYACPRIQKLSVDGDAAAEPGDTLVARLEAKDPNGGPLKVTWRLTSDGGQMGLNGDKEDLPNVITGAISGSGPTQAKVTLPQVPGPYRLFAIIRNTHGGAATANIPLRVRGAEPIAMGSKAKLPVNLYSDSDKPLPFAPTGWMGNVAAMKLDMAHKSNPHLGSTCIRWDYSASDNWGAIAWQSPEGDWGDKPGGLDLTGATKLVIWARGARGGEQVSFGMGIIHNERKFFDTAIIDGGRKTLTSLWQRYEISLRGMDLRRIKTGFVMTLASNGTPQSIFLDDISVE